MNRRLLRAGLALALAACSSGAPRGDASPYDPQALPSGPVGKSIAYGHELIVQTPRLMKEYVRAGMSCDACHINAGTKAKGGSFAGIYGEFPQWNKRAHRVIALQDRIAECFLYSMNGRAPAYASREMIAIVAYIAWLSRGRSIGAKQPASERYLEPLPHASPSISRGATIYTQKCAACHQVNGAGLAGTFPPLWGPTSFNNGAGMAHIDRMTGFVRFNMPQNAPGSLSLADAYDVAAFVLHHDRPRFDKNALVPVPELPAKYF